MVATQNAVGTTAQHVAWEHTDPSRASYAATLHSGQMLYSGENGQAELDPLGSNVGLQAPQTEQIGSGGGGWGHGTWGDPFGSYTCMRDWVIEPCSLVRQALNAGAAVMGPLDQFRQVQNPRSGEIAWGQFHAYANGMAGWWADTAGPNPGDVDSVHIPFNSDRNSVPFSIFSSPNSDSITQDPTTILPLTTRPGKTYPASSKSNDCDEIRDTLIKLYYFIKDKFKDQIENRGGLWEEHREQIITRQTQIKRELKKFDDNDCKSNGDPRIKELRELAQAPMPTPQNQEFRMPVDSPPIFIPVRPSIPLVPNPGLVPATPIPPMIFPPGWECIYLPQLCRSIDA